MKAILFTNDHKVHLKGVNPSKLWFNYRGKLYDLDATAIVMDEYAEKEKMPKPRLVYFENSAEPLRFSKAPEPDPSNGYLEKYLKLNAVRTQNRPSFLSKIAPGLERLAGMFTIQNFIIIIIVGSMIYSALQGAGYV